MKKLLTIGLLSLSSLLAASTAEPISVIVAEKNINTSQVELGKQLFFDPRLSKSGFISCNSCHKLSMGGTDNLKTSIGHNWQQGPINSPTVLNSSMNLAQFWDGRAKDLQEQAGGPIANPKEMASNHTLALEVISSIPQYAAQFNQIFSTETITIEQVTQVIAEFEKTLTTPNSKFDQWLSGNKNALTKQELAGYQLFKNIGCTSCHNGAAVGGNMYQKMGLVQAYKTENPALGRIDVTKKASDKYVFKVPTLRNIELTYPYFHDGEAATLTQAVDTMARLQLGKTLSKEENIKIVAFLKTLTGDQPQFALPQLPASTDNTPKPTPFK